MKKPDLLYIIGPGGEPYDELRYSLRSVAANLPHRDIVIVGNKPDWVRGVEHVPTAQVSRSKYRNALTNLVTGCQLDHLTETVVLMNDDFYAMSPGTPAPVAHRGTIRDMLTQQVTDKNRRNVDYIWALGKAREHLEQEGIDEPLSYELHMPMPIHRRTLLDIAGRYNPDDKLIGVAKRSLYGNLAGVGGLQTTDTRPIRRGFWDWHWLATADRDFRQVYHDYLRHKFPDPCYYEDARTAPRTRTRCWISTENTGGSRLKIHPDRAPQTADLDADPQWLAV